jgi:hypothetical protein
MLALAGVAGPLLFTVFVILQGLLIPAYSHVRLPISALEAWPTGWRIQRLNCSPPGSWRTGYCVSWPLPLGDDRWRAHRDAASHVVGAIMTFAATGLGWLIFSRRMSADRQWRDLSTHTMATSVAMLVLFVALGFFAVDEGTPLHPWAGLLQRVLCVVWFTLLIVLAIRLRRVARCMAAITVSGPRRFSHFAM